MYGSVRMSNNWRVTLSRGGKRFLRGSAFSRYGGEPAALACAQAYRDEIVRQHSPPERRELAQKLHQTKKSGVSGVTFRLNANREIMSWHALTRVNADRLLTKSFGVKRYGAAQAECLAIAEREKQLKQMKGLRKVHPAEQSVGVNAVKAPDALKGTAGRSRRTLSKPIAVVEILRKNKNSGMPGVSCIKSADGLPRYWLAKTGGIDGRRPACWQLLRAESNCASKRTHSFGPRIPTEKGKVMVHSRLGILRLLTGRMYLASRRSGEGY